MITRANDRHRGRYSGDVMVNAMSRPRSRWLCTLSSQVLAALLCLVWLPEPAEAQSPNQQPSPSPLARCRAITDEKLRLSCYEHSTSTSTGQSDQHALTSGWKLVRTKNPADGREIISIMQTADISRSDLNFAGLMLRCNGGSFQIVFALIEPLPPRARPQITLSAGSAKVTFAASVLSPGLLISLPAEASTLAEEPWLTVPELKVSIRDQESHIDGVIPLTGLRSGLQLLRSNCPPQ